MQSAYPGKIRDMYLTGNQKAIFHMVPDTEKSAVRRSHAGNGFLAENTLIIRPEILKIRLSDCWYLE